MYGLLKGYASRKPSGEGSHGLNEDQGSHAEVSEEYLVNPSASLHPPGNNTDNAGYGRFISWGFDGVSYLGSQVKLRVDKSFSWLSNQDSQDENVIKMATSKRSSSRQPEGSIPYSVSGSDTLAKIALIYDTTPSELTRMNRLTSRMLYTGQVLYVPDKTKSISGPSSKQDHDCPEDKIETVQANLPQQGYREKIKLTKKVSLTSDDEEEISTTFLKIKAKHITDGQGVVSGVVLITPHSVIFNPNVSDPLVMDRGRDSYFIKTPMSAVTSAALYKDIAAMAIHDPLKSGRFYLDESTRESVSRQNSIDVDTFKTGTSQQVRLDTTPEISDDNLNVQQNNEKNNTNYEANGLQEPVSSSIVNRGGNGTQAKELTEHEQLIQIANELLSDLISDIVGSVCEEQKPKYLECSDTIEQASQLDTNSILLSPMSEDSGICSPHNKCTDKGAKSVEGHNNEAEKGPSSCDNSEGSSVHTNKGLSEHCDPDTSQDSVMENTGAGTRKRQSSFLESLSGEVKYWLGVGYNYEDDHAFEEQIVPRPATSYEDNLVYLCIRISKQHWCMCLTGEGYHSSKGAEAMMNRDKRRREHWFAIPASRIEHVYGFMKQYCPNIKRTLSHSEEEDDDDSLLLEEEEEDEIQMTSPTVEQSLSLEISRPSSCTTKESVITPDSLSDDLMFMPEMSSESQILSVALIKKLNKNLPSRAVGHGWTLAYSTFNHGFSLKTLYRNMEEFDTPMLIVVLDDEHQIFGVVTSCPLKVSEGFYGTGQSFLFKFEDEEIKTYHWQGDNYFFIKGSVDCIAFGGGGGHFGLWLDEDFYHGSSHFSETYHNETLSKHEDFLCSALEAWTFM